MQEIPKELKYSESHEWVRKEADGTVVIGITDHAQQQLGELVFVDLPDLDDAITVSSNDDVCVVESVKAASDVYAPVSGKVIAVNENLEEAPGLVNSDPYGDGWLFKIEPSDLEEYSELLDPASYETLTMEVED